MLDVLAADRARVGERMTAETWWGAPAQGLGAALLVASPAAGWWAWVLYVLSLAIFIAVEMVFRRRSGLGITRPAGPVGIWLLIAVCAVMFVTFGVSVVLALFGLPWWSVAAGGVAGIATTFLVVAYDRTFAAEVSNAR